MFLSSMMHSNPESEGISAGNILNPKKLETLANSVFGARTTQDAHEISREIQGLISIRPEHQEGLSSLANATRIALETDSLSVNREEYLLKGITELVKSLSLSDDVENFVLEAIDLLQGEIGKGELIFARDQLLNAIEIINDSNEAEESDRQKLKTLSGHVESIFTAAIFTPLDGRINRNLQVKSLTNATRPKLSFALEVAIKRRTEPILIREHLLDISDFEIDGISSTFELEDPNENTDKVFYALYEIGTKQLAAGEAKQAIWFFDLISAFPTAKVHRDFCVAYIRTCRLLGDYSKARTLFTRSSDILRECPEAQDEIHQSFIDEHRMGSGAHYARSQYINFMREEGVVIDPKEALASRERLSQDHDQEETVNTSTPIITKDQKYYLLRSIGLSMMETGDRKNAQTAFSWAVGFPNARYDSLLWLKYERIYSDTAKEEKDPDVTSKLIGYASDILVLAIIEGSRDEAIINRLYEIFVDLFEEQYAFSEMTHMLMAKNVDSDTIEFIINTIEKNFGVEYGREFEDTRKQGKTAQLEPDPEPIEDTGDSAIPELNPIEQAAETALNSNAEFLAAKGEAIRSIGNPDKYIEAVKAAFAHLDDPNLIFSSPSHIQLIEETSNALRRKVEQEGIEIDKDQAFFGELTEIARDTKIDLRALSSYYLKLPEEFSRLCNIARTHFERGNYLKAIDEYGRAIELIKLAGGDPNFLCYSEYKEIFDSLEQACEVTYGAENRIRFAELLENYGISGGVLGEARFGALLSNGQMFKDGDKVDREVTSDRKTPGILERWRGRLLDMIPKRQHGGFEEWGKEFDDDDDNQ